MKKMSIKKAILSIMCAIVFACTGLLAFNIFGGREKTFRQNEKFSSATTSNLSITYPNSNSLGQFVNGYIYNFTDKSKIDGFRNGSLDSDTTQIVVDTTKAHGSKQNPYVIANENDWEKLVKLCGTTGGTADQYYVLGYRF